MYLAWQNTNFDLWKNCCYAKMLYNLYFIYKSISGGAKMDFWISSEGEELFTPPSQEEAQLRIMKIIADISFVKS